jgi:hypothetical protein
MSTLSCTFYETFRAAFIRSFETAIGTTYWRAIPSTNGYPHSTTYQGSERWPHHSTNITTIITTVQFSFKMPDEPAYIQAILSTILSTIWKSHKSACRGSINAAIFTTHRIPLDAAIFTTIGKSNSSTYFKPKHATIFWSYKLSDWPTK